MKKAREVLVKPETSDTISPGLRSDNEWLQYKSDMSEQELIEYWDKPFNVKKQAGFYTWSKSQIILRKSDDSQLQNPSFLCDNFTKFFNDLSKREKFVQLNSSEQVKGKDRFSLLKFDFYSLLFESFGCEMVKYLSPYLMKFCSSPEECEQICASEIAAGFMRGNIFEYSKEYITYIICTRDPPNVPCSVECSVIFIEFSVPLFNGGTGEGKKEALFLAFLAFF